ncbi:MAG: hypothetical protein M3N47_13005 [Chloroflexota bacterium]|nr:hypothetical protein [Chloroflexota bacterium]
MVLRKRIARVMLVAAGFGVAATVYRLAALVLTNLHVPGSLDWSNPLAVWLALLGGAVAALPFCVVAYRVRAGRSLVAAVAAVLVLLATGVAYPVACDTTESFLDRPNRRCTCAGLAVNWYPRGTFDYSDVEYCIGVEVAVR